MPLPRCDGLPPEMVLLLVASLVGAVVWGSCTVAGPVVTLVEVGVAVMVVEVDGE